MGSAGDLRVAPWHQEGDGAIREAIRSSQGTRATIAARSKFSSLTQRSHLNRIPQTEMKGRDSSRASATECYALLIIPVTCNQEPKGILNSHSDLSTHGLLAPSL